MRAALVGKYPEGTYEKLCEALAGEQIEVVSIADEDTYAGLCDAEIIILRIFKAPGEVMIRNPHLKLIIRWGAGYDSVDIEEADRRGIMVANTPGANAGAVADLAVLMMLSVGRKLYCHRDCLSRGEWSRNTFLDSSVTLNGKKVGILGGGNIGRRVAERVRVFGAEAQYFDLFRLPEPVEWEFHMKYVPFDTLIETSDVLTLHIPLLKDNRHIIGAGEIERMRRGAILVNVARGGLVDEEALLCAVREKKILGAGLDCVEREPLHPDDALLHEPDIIITPHIGGGTADLPDVILPMITDNIRAMARGETIKYVVNNPQNFIVKP